MNDDHKLEVSRTSVSIDGVDLSRIVSGVSLVATNDCELYVARATP